MVRQLPLAVAARQGFEGKYLGADTNWQLAKRMRVVESLLLVQIDQSFELFDVSEGIICGQPHDVRHAE